MVGVMTRSLPLTASSALPTGMMSAVPAVMLVIVMLPVVLVATSSSKVTVIEAGVPTVSPAAGQSVENVGAVVSPNAAISAALSARS